MDSLNLGGLERKFAWNCFNNDDSFFFIYHSLEVIFIHYNLVQVENCDWDIDYNGKFRLAPVAGTGFSHRLTEYKIVGHFFGLSYLNISVNNQIENISWDISLDCLI